MNIVLSIHFIKPKKNACDRIVKLCVCVCVQDVLSHAMTVMQSRTAMTVMQSRTAMTVMQSRTAMTVMQSRTAMTVMQVRGSCHDSGSASGVTASSPP